jgi:diguanylate cyclase (GGDEF)-like protein/PAS domain S-box-containing protein
MQHLTLHNLLEHWQTRLNRWFTPPVFPDNDLKTLRAALLNIITSSTLIAIFIIILANLIGGNTPPLVFLLNTIIFLSCLVILYWLRRKHIQWASIILVGWGIFYITFALINLGTVRGPTTTAYTILVISAGILFDRKGLIASFVACSAIILGLIAAENSGLIHHTDTPFTLTQWIIYTCIIGISGFITLWTLQELRNTLEHANIEIAESLIRTQRDLSFAIASAVNFETILERVLNSTLEIHGLDSGGVYLVDEQTGALDLIVHRGLSAEFVERSKHFPANSPQTKLVMQGQMIYRPYKEILAHLNTPNIQEPLRASLIMPILHEGRVIATLNLASHTHDEISVSARQVLESMAAQMGGVIARIQTENALHSSQRKLQTLFDTMDDFLFILDIQGNILQTNPVALQRLQYTAQEIVGKSIFDLHPPERRAETEKIVAEMLIGISDYCDIPLLAKDGTHIPVETKTHLGKWDEQTVLFGISRDITERIRLKQKLQEQHDFAMTVMSTMGQGLSVSNSKRQIEYINPACAQMLGYTPKELIGTLTKDLYHPPDLGILESTHAERVTGRTTANEVRLKHKDGSLVHVLITATPRWRDNQIDGTVAVITDLTERKRAEEILRASVERYRNLFDNLPIPVFTKDLNGRYTSCNAEDLKYWSTHPVGHTDLELLPATYAEMLIQVDDQVITHQTPMNIEEQLYAPFGVRTMQSRKVPLRDTNGQIIGILGAGVDITERKQVEAQLRASEELYRQMFDNHSAIKLLIEPISGKIVDANFAAAEFYGYARATLLQMNINQINTLATEQMEQMHQNVLNRTRTYFILTHRLAGGELRDVESYTVPIQTQERTVLYSVIHDITARRQVEDQLRYLSTHDSLTGLFNRAFFESEMIRYTPSREFPISLIIADADNLKITNDTRGHAMGDKILQHIARALQASCRASDIIARIGGDEFAILLPETNAMTANQIVTRIHQKVMGEQQQASPDLPLHVSVGVATTDNKRLDQAFRLADERMYTNKRAYKHTL